MKKRQSKETYTYIDNYIKKQSCIDSDELMKFVSNTIELPEYEELIIDYCRKIGNNGVRRIRDKKGLRVFFSNGVKVNSKYINIDRATVSNIDDVNNALKTQLKLQSRLKKNIKKLKSTSKILDGQISLEEYGKAKENNDIESSGAL